MEDDIQQKVLPSKYNFFKKNDPNRLVYDSQSQLLTRNTSVGDQSNDSALNLPTQSGYHTISTKQSMGILKSLSESKLNTWDSKQ
jgi:hypothetical protein